MIWKLLYVEYKHNFFKCNSRSFFTTHQYTSTCAPFVARRTSNRQSVSLHVFSSMSSVIVAKASVILVFRFVMSGTGVKNTLSLTYRHNHTVRHPRCVFVNYNWINQLSNTTIWWLDICCLLHRYQLYVSALMVIFRLIDWQKACKQLYFGIRLVYGGGGLGLDGGTRFCVCWVGRVMWVHGYYCAGLSLYKFV